MEGVYKTSLLLIHSLTQLDGVCNQFKGTPTDDNGEKIIEIIDKCEEKFLKVKEEIVRMIKDVEKNANNAQNEGIEEDHVIQAIQTKQGFLIKE